MRLKRLALIAIVLFISLDITFAQNKTTTQQNQNPILEKENQRVNADAMDLINQFNMQSGYSMGPPKQIPIDKTINPHKYIVGPNDIFTLGLYGYLNQQIPLIVNLEGSIVIPTVGEIKVDGLTLNQAKEKVIYAVKKRYYSSDVSFILATPRNFIISISGAVQKKFEVNSLTRTSDIITYIVYDTLNPALDQYKKNLNFEFFLPDVSLRNIEIIRKNGYIDQVDLYRFFYTNDDKFNPYFQDGDLLKVPSGQLTQNFVSVNGAVQLGGVYEYNDEDNLSSVVNLARGFDKDANIDSVSVFRFNKETQKLEAITVNFNTDPDFKVNVFDRIFVKYNTIPIKSLSVTVLGEVERPGIYPIAFKKTTLKDVIELAGGFLPTAYLPLSIVFRRYDEEYMKTDTAEILVNMRANDLIINEKDKLSFERDVISRRNRMVVDFEKLFKENDSTQNIFLENRDVIYVNDNKNIVYVYGQVSNEGFVPYIEGKDYKYYIEKAGGFSLAADEGNTRIIKFNSRGWYEADKAKVNSGDFIYVPKHIPAEFKESLTIIATMIGVVASILTTTLLILQQNK